ncbi:hypothetical protein BDQ17DRAFT_1430821 [Cyathus striatus]|nr:hypothetical protein BDQ17DRAFT_1430821 [Cyathus striatus]
MLLDIALPHITLRMNSKVTSVDPSLPSVTLQSGETIHADLIIGADGVKSHLRTPSSGPRPSQVHRRRSVPSVNPDGRDHQRPELKILVDQPVRLYGWGYEAFGGILRPAGHLDHPSGKFTLLGDACHPMLPYHAQGAAMAIEDESVLGTLFTNLTSPTQIPAFLKAYELIRKARATETQLASRMNQRIFHYSDGLEQEARDASCARYADCFAEAKGESESDAFGYDAEAEAEDGGLRMGRGVRRDDLIFFSSSLAISKFPPTLRYSTPPVPRILPNRTHIGRMIKPFTLIAPIRPVRTVHSNEIRTSANGMHVNPPHDNKQPILNHLIERYSTYRGQDTLDSPLFR